MFTWTTPSMDITEFSMLITAGQPVSFHYVHWSSVRASWIATAGDVRKFVALATQADAKAWVESQYLLREEK